MVVVYVTQPPLIDHIFMNITPFLLKLVYNGIVLS